jgi:deoxyadenosine/deoxycytidine kinase
VWLSIDGNVSSGKSTLVELIKENLETTKITVVVYPEMGHEGKTLVKYLRNVAKLSAMFQAHMLGMCVAREENAVLHSTLVAALGLEEEPKVVVVDRTITGNGVFAMTNHFFTPNLGPDEFDFYKTNWKKAMRGAGRVPFAHGNLSVYLHARVGDSIRRCLKRSRDVEASAYDRAYFQNLECMGMLAILANLSQRHPHPQLVLDWCDDAEDPYEKFGRIMSGYMGSDLAQPPSRVTLARVKPLVSPPSPVSSSSSSSEEGEGEGDDTVAEGEEGDGKGDEGAIPFTSFVYLNKVTSEEAFFSYWNVCTMFDNIACNTSASFEPKHLCIIVPDCLTTRPFDGLFSLRIVSLTQDFLYKKEAEIIKANYLNNKYHGHVPLMSWE